MSQNGFWADKYPFYLTALFHFIPGTEYRKDENEEKSKIWYSTSVLEGHVACRLGSSDGKEFYRPNHNDEIQIKIRYSTISKDKNTDSLYFSTNINNKDIGDIDININDHESTLIKIISSDHDIYLKNIRLEINIYESDRGKNGYFKISTMNLLYQHKFKKKSFLQRLLPT